MSSSSSKCHYCNPSFLNCFLLTICYLQLLTLLLQPQLCASEDGAQPGSQASHHLPVESHHSLHHPFDVSMPHWKYGGATVCTESMVRLTPSAQSRNGWLFNEFALQSADWEIEVHFEARADYHIGGDGWAIWILNDTHHPRKHRNTLHHSYLTGNIFGITKDFEGFGVAFDTYDNDNKRDNPSIFALKQTQDSKIDWDSEADFANTMVKSTYPPDANIDYHCTIDYRNKNRVRVILRYINNVLHVYLNTNQDTTSYELCFAVEIGIDVFFPLKSGAYYIAMSAITGQVADIHDIYSLSTRYLDASDTKAIDDTKLQSSGYYRGRAISYRMIFFWLAQIAAICFILFECIYEYLQFDKLRYENLAPITLCQRLNYWIFLAYCVHFLQFFLLVFISKWLILVLNLPIIVWRANKYMTHSFKLEAIKIRKIRNFFDVGQTWGTILKSTIYIITLFTCIYNLFS